MYRISERSDWRHARYKIKNVVAVGADLNNTVSPSAVVTQIIPDGFEVNIGGLRNIKLKWSVLECCWKELSKDDVYDQSVFKNPFEQAFLDCDCLNFVVRRLLRKSGLLSRCDEEQINLQF